MSAPLTFGLHVAGQFSPMDDVPARVHELYEQARLAKRYGFDSIFTFQHYLANLQSLQCVPLLSRLAAEAEGLSFGTNILILPLHHPVEIAELFATLDVFTGGKAILGAAIGYRENEFASFGINRKHRVGRFEEGVQVIRGLWSGQPYSFEGKHFRIDNQKISLAPKRPGGPPIWVGAGMEPAISRAARIGDAWLIPQDFKWKRVAGLLDFYRRELEAVGKPTGGQEYPLTREVFLAPDRQTALDEAHIWMRQEYGLYADLGFWWFREKFWEYYKDSFIIGDARDCIEAFQRARDLGVTKLILRTQWFGMPQEKVARTLRVLGEEVLPHFRGGDA